MSDLPASAAPRQVPCPTCGTPSLFAPSNRWRPFCSERCRRVDFFRWFEGKYAIEEPLGPLQLA
ncbi:MAG: DNA gyrase inhibitor YacG, partial [Verrucomicrobiales bacterium]